MVARAKPSPNPLPEGEGGYATCLEVESACIIQIHRQIRLLAACDFTTLNIFLQGRNTS
jgi:hypothetical protein